MKNASPVAVLALLSPLLAQDPGRGTAFGEVRDRQDQPWAAAEVVFLSELVPGLSAAFAFDHQVVKSDAKGRFRAALLPNRPYTVFARGPDPAREGRYRVSGVHHFVRARDQLRLNEVKGGMQDAELQLQGAEQFAADGPFRIVAEYDFDPRKQGEVPADAEGRRWIRAWPGSVRVMAYDKAGRLRGLVVRQRARRPELGLRLYKLEEPGLLVVDKQGKPVAGAKVYTQGYLRGGERLTPAGKTDQAGRIQVIRQTLGPLQVVVTAPGFGWSKLWDNGMRRKRKSGKDADKPTKLTLVPLSTRRRQVLIGPDTRPADLRSVRHVPEAMLWAGMAGMGNEVHIMGQRPTLEELPGGQLKITRSGQERGMLVHGGASNLRILLSAAARRQLPPTWQAHIPWSLELPERSLEGKGPLDLQSFVPVCVQIYDHRGNPVERASVAFEDAQERRVAWVGDSGTPEYENLSDRSGRAWLLVPPGQRAMLHVAYPFDHSVPYAFAQAELQAIPGPVQAGFSQLELRLSAPLRIHGEVVDAKGKPMAGVDVRLLPGDVQSQREAMEGAVVEQVMELEGRAAQPAALPGRKGRLAYRVRPADELKLGRSLHLSMYQPQRSDAQGRFEFLLPDLPKGEQSKFTLLAEHTRLVFFKAKGRTLVEVTQGKPSPGQKLVLK